MARWLLPLAVLVAFIAGCHGDRTSTRSCADRGDCVALYESCASVDQCSVEADECFTVAWEVGRDGTMCSAYCTVHEDCPGNSACYELVGDPSMERVCFKRCDTNLDCPSDHQCVDAEMGGGIVDAICLPN
jgi:hypothetical protein